jgi:hypothetical protein
VGRSRYKWTEAKIRKWVKQGRGQGAGAYYLSWLRVSDVPSKGFSHRIWGELTHRVHHLLSYLEYQVYLWCLLMGRLCDIREAYPLNREDTRRIAKQLGIAHPRYPGTRIDIVMTTDLLLTRPGDPAVYIALAVKPAALLADSRVMEKLAIERVYWLERGVTFFVVTEKELPQVILENFERIRFAMNLSLHPDFSVAQARDLQRELLRYLPLRRDVTYESFCTEFDGRLHLQTGDTHYLLTNLMGHGVLTVDMNRAWDVRHLIGDIQIFQDGLDKLSRDEGGLE